jgi:hypothetical protein
MAENEEKRKYIIKKFNESRDLDPVKMKYYSEEKDQMYETLAMSKTLALRVNKIEKMPFDLRYSEGMSYNIINPQDITDDQGLKRVQLREQMRMNRIKKIKIEAAQRLAGESAYSRNEEMRMGRVKYDRFKYQLERGYNPINLTTELPVPLYGTAPPTMWSRVQRDSSSGTSS